MPHVDEGTLHAYLDGALDALLEAGALPHGVTRDSIDAHLTVCADCRALLEAERTIRTRAGAVLDAAVPAIEMPPFSELFARSRPHARRRAWPLAWAASVLLALGAGFWGSELFRDQNRMASLDDSAAPAASAPQSQRAVTEADARADAAGMAESVAAPAPPAGVDGAGAGAGLQDAAQVGAVGARPENARAADETSGRGAAAAAAPPRPSAETERALAAPAQALQVPAEPAGRALAADAQARQAPAETEAARLARSQNARRAPAGETGRVEGAVLDSITVTARRDTLVRRTVPGTVATVVTAPVPPSAPPPAAAEQRAARSDFREAAPRDQATAAELERFRQHLAELDAGRVSLTAGAVSAELPPLQLEAGSRPAVQRGVLLGAALARITQRAPDGVEVELIVWRAVPVELNEIVAGDVAHRVQTDSPAARARRQRTEPEVAQKQRSAVGGPVAHTVLGSSPLPDGRHQLLLWSVGHAVFVALRAPLSAAELQALAQRLVEVQRY